VTDTIDPPADASSAPQKKRTGGLNSLLIADLKAMAGGLGIAGSGSMKKAQLVDAIKAAQSGGRSGGRTRSQGDQAGGVQRDERGRESQPERPLQDRQQDRQQDRRAAAVPVEQPTTDSGEAAGPRTKRERIRDDQPRQADRPQQDRQSDRQQADRQADRQQADPQQDGQQDRQTDRQQDQRDRTEDRDGQQQGGTQNQDNQQNNQQANRFDEESGSRRNRRRRGRDRERTPDRQAERPVARQGTSSNAMRNEPDTQILEDDVLVPAAGILDVLDNYAFVRTSGYLPGSDDVYLSLSMVRKFGMRRGDAIVGQVRQPREGERKEKFNPMVRVDTVNGADPEASKNRVEFSKLTPLYPSERLRLETTPTNLIGRVIDIASPIGKGQRGLIVSPSKAGKTMIMQSIANSITTNNPECHLMVVLVDERPEEVTDFERSVKGEVISSTFDRPASDHTTVAELAIERAKRLVELGHDVVVLLDGITRLGRAYNLAAPASGRILSGGVDSAALYPPKRFFGAARNIENGGSLTILATALIESGSKMDEVIFEEFKGTGNMEIRLRRDFADKRLFPAIDAVQSGTRREELLMSKEELAIVWKLRRVLSGLDGQQALELLLERLKKSQSNIEFLMQVQKTTPSAHGD